MKHFHFVILVAALSIFSCRQGKPKNDPALRLTELRKQVKELNDEIATLEKNLAERDTTGSQNAKAKLVSVDTLRKQNFKHFIELQGFVDARQNILVAPQMPGIVTRIYVREGDYVQAGKILATLDGSTILKGIEEVKTALQLAQTMFEKQKKLWDQNIGSEAQYLQAKGQKEQLEQRLQSMQSQLSMTYIKSPISGTVDEVKLKLGEPASPGFTGIRVVNASDLSVKAKLSDLYASKVKKGDPVKLYFPDWDKEFDSKLIYAGQTVSANSRTIQIEAQLPKVKQKFLANQVVKMKINDKEMKNVIVVPSNIIQKSIDGEDYVLVAENNGGNWYAKKKIVVVSASYNGESVISSGLNAGEAFIKTGYSEIVDGQLIQL